MIRVALYTRISTGDQDAGNQQAQLIRFARSQKWKVTQTFTDTASGGRSDRKEFQKLMAAAAQHRFDLVLFWSLDRFSREGVARTLHYLQLLEAWGVGFRSFTEPYLDSLGIFKDAILALLATLAKQERIRIGERTKAGLQRARQRGSKLGRPPIHSALAAQALTLRRKGFSLSRIAKELGISKTTAFRLFHAVLLPPG
ncbi:MAG: recombinase family protein [Verrucomicrobiae bacterium]|nr:recombinase family protein [Verrucomicrobiae bacterium]